MPQLFANNISTTLNGTITTGATSLIVASATGFPTPAAPDYFYMTISNTAETQWEVVKVTAVSGTTFTIVRAQDGTTAVAWTSGATIEMRPVAQGLRDIGTATDHAIRGQFKNLLSSSTGASVTVTETVDEIILENLATNLYMVARALALTGALTTSGAGGLDNSAPQAVTATSATPCVFGLTGHGYANNAAVVLGGTAVPTGFTAGTTYYVVATAASTFELSATQGGAAIASTSTGTAVTVASKAANGAWYSKWVIYNPATATAALLLSSSTTNPVLPSGYTYSARTGWIRSDASGSFYPLHYDQAGRNVKYAVTPGSLNVQTFPVLASGAQGTYNTAWANISLLAAIPPTAIAVELILRQGGSASNSMVATTNGSTTFNDATAICPEFGATNGTGGVMVILVNKTFYLEGAQSLYYICGDATYGLLACSGWVDNL